MKRVLAFFITISICIFLGSCRHQETYRFLNSTDEISGISIITISFNEDQDVIQKELKIIEDINDFLDDFIKVDCYTYYGDPTGITEEGVEANVIKILYENGEYELINWNGQAEYTSDKGFCYYSGYSVFDEKQFELLITKYL